MYWSLILQQFIASTTHIISKSALMTIPAPFLLLLRAFIASMFYIIFLKIRGTKLLKIELKDLPLFILLGILNVPINQFLFFNSLKYTSPPNVALAYALTPAFVMVIAFFLLKERISFANTIGIFIAIFGTVLVLFEKGIILQSEAFYGNILALLASLAWAFYTIIGKKFVNKYGAVYTTAVAMLFGLIIFLPVFFISGGEFIFSLLSSYDWMQIIYLGIVTSGIAYILWYLALKKLESSKVAVFNNLQPILTTIMSIIVFGTQLTLLFVLGGLLTIFGVILSQKK